MGPDYIPVIVSRPWYQILKSILVQDRRSADPLATKHREADTTVVAMGRHEAYHEMTKWMLGGDVLACAHSCMKRKKGIRTLRKRLFYLRVESYGKYRPG